MGPDRRAADAGVPRSARVRGAKARRSLAYGDEGMRLTKSRVAGRHGFLKNFTCHLTLSAEDGSTGVALSDGWRTLRKGNK